MAVRPVIAVLCQDRRSKIGVDGRNRGGQFKLTGLERRDKITRIELAVTIPVTLRPERIAGDIVFVLTRLKDEHEVSRRKESVEVGITGGGLQDILDHRVQIGVVDQFIGVQIK